MDRSKVERFAALFAGFDDAYGTHGAMDPRTPAGKQAIKTTARTLRGEVTFSLWEDHVEGRQPLGIIPVKIDGTCRWACIDVDQYDINLGETIAELRKRRLPMIGCRSKSGGLHVFIFFAKSEPAEEVRAKLKEIAATLGWAGCEIFPKQSTILAERGDVGNWLNMPYFGGDATERYMVKEGGLAGTMSEFLVAAEEARTSLESLNLVKAPKAKDESLDDGPPCLQHLTTVGFPEGTRNNGLFGLGVFCRKKYGEEWKTVLRKYNAQFLTPPLPEEEVDGLIKNLERGDYNYRCKDQPCVNYCNAALCRTRVHGVKGGGTFPSITGAVCIDSEPKLWFLTVDDQRIEATSRDLCNYKMFCELAAERINKFYMPMKAGDFAMLISAATEGAQHVASAPEASVRGHFMELLGDFLTDRYKGESIEDVVGGKPYLNEEDGRYYFQLRHLMKHLDREGFRHWGRNVVAARLKELGGDRFFNVKGKGISTFWVTRTLFETPPETPLPLSRRDPI